MRKKQTGNQLQVEPWHRNPSSWAQRIPICVLAMVGTLISSYLALYQMGLISSVWDPFFGDGSERVLDSDVSETMRAWLRLPDAALGAIAYLGDAIFGLAGSTKRWYYRPWLVILFGIDVIPLGIVSIILVILQGTVVGYWCFLCLVSALISLVLILLAFDEVWSSLLLLKKVYQQSEGREAFWACFWGKPHPLVESVGAEMVSYRYVA